MTITKSRPKVGTCNGCGERRNALALYRVDMAGPDGKPARVERACIIRHHLSAVGRDPEEVAS